MDNQGRKVDKRIRDGQDSLGHFLGTSWFESYRKRVTQESSIAKVERTLGKASKIIYDLAWSVDHQDEQSDRGRSRKKRDASESVLDTTLAIVRREGQYRPQSLGRVSIYREGKSRSSSLFEFLIVLFNSIRWNWRRKNGRQLANEWTSCHLTIQKSWCVQRW